MRGNHALAGIGRPGFNTRATNLHRQKSLFTPAENGERAVGRNLVQAFTVIEVIAKLGSICLVLLYDAGAKFAVVPKVVTQSAHECGVFTEALHKNVTGALESSFDIFDVIFA